MARRAGAVAIVVVALIASACATAPAASPDQTGPSAAASLAPSAPGPTIAAPSADASVEPAEDVTAWSFDGEETDPDGFVVIEGQPDDFEEPTLDDADLIGEIGDMDAEGTSSEIFDDTEIPPLDPCSLITLDEWAAWRNVDVSAAANVELEYGDACGYVTDDDEIRLAITVVDHGLEPWLSDDVLTIQVDVGNSVGSWATGYPVDGSSLLVVDLGAADLILEISSRDGTGSETLRDGAVHLASLAMLRYEP